MVTLQVEPGHAHTTLQPDGIRSAIPIMAFFTVAGLRSVLAAPVDRRGSWLFRVLIGCPRSGHLAGAYLWISLATFLIGSSTALLLHSLSPPAMKISRIATGQVLVAIGLALLLPDVLLFSVRGIPFIGVVACEILDRIPMSEIGIAVSKRFRAAVVDNFRSFALKNLGHSRNL
ncbi:hypothetical protein HDF13_003829 [Edaphobacter lichenicola]|uniref:Uncharacterized protein n=1 Tax=Tunturiibacter gelidiferens TaxID=3069689 RepID=A0ACC5P4E4_9BACT|nr:hypothetical protein [Edaphobacter lichenicola]